MPKITACPPKFSKEKLGVAQSNKYSPRLSSNEKIKLIKRVKAGESVVKVCREVGISRTIFYRWQKKYEQAASRTKPKALVSRVAKEKRHWKKLSAGVERKIIKSALKNPLFSPQKLGQMVGVSGHGAWNVLKMHGLNTQESRNAYIRQYGSSLVRPARIDDKVTMIRRHKAGEKVANLCREFNISRTAYYKWLKRYNQAAQEKKRQVLSSWRPREENHWRHVPQAKELVLEIVLEKPELSSQKIAQLLPVKKGRPILGNHGVFNLLKRLNLNTIEKRLAYSQSQAPTLAPVSRFAGTIRKLIGVIPSISAIPPPPSLTWLRKGKPSLPSFRGIALSPLLRPFIASLLTSLLIFNFSAYWINMIANTPTLGGKVGMVFASMALAIGGFFFTYSMKYYFTLAIVLSFSRQSEEDGGGLIANLNGRLNGSSGTTPGVSDSTPGVKGGKGLIAWVARIFGINADIADGKLMNT
ncbi:helix-turn-helix domain-containing protein, partial [Patescibacteria group bacterium]